MSIFGIKNGKQAYPQPNIYIYMFMSITQNAKNVKIAKNAGNALKMLKS